MLILGDYCQDENEQKLKKNFFSSNRMVQNNVQILEDSPFQETRNRQVIQPQW